jgi:hypothetical protein
MWVTTRRITVEDLPALGQDEPWVRRFVDRSDPALAYSMDGELIAVAGFVPVGSVLTDTAYLWMNSTPAVARHKVAVGRWGIQTLREVRRLKYPRIIGHCEAGSRSVLWLRSLGARFTPGPRGTVEFEIGGAA